MTHPLEGALVDSGAEEEGFKYAMAYVTSAKHDLRNLNAMVAASTQQLHATVHCSDVAQFHTSSDAAFLAEVGSLVAVVAVVCMWILYPSEFWAFFRAMVRPKSKIRRL
jgi:hypothetical protein